LAIIFTAARCYTRFSMFHSLKSDDFWILLGLVSSSTLPLEIHH
jgi:hypothetical protein